MLGETLIDWIQTASVIPLAVLFPLASAARLDPGETLKRDVDVDFPAKGLREAALKEIRVELKYTAAPFKREALDFPVAVTEKQARAD